MNTRNPLAEGGPPLAGTAKPAGIYPPAFLLAVGLAAAGSLAGVAWWSASADRLAPAAQAAADQPGLPDVLRELRFIDEADGSVRVLDASTGVVLDTLVGEEGFVRSAVRGLAQARKQQGIGAERPFLLVRRPDGGINFEDPATGRKISLEAFGSTNAAAFKRLLPQSAPSADPAPSDSLRR